MYYGAVAKWAGAHPMCQMYIVFGRVLTIARFSKRWSPWPISNPGGAERFLA
jgi:hypothetical protein